MIVFFNLVSKYSMFWDSDGPAPFFANLFLYNYKSKWIKKIKTTDTRRARRFANTFRFIDDLRTVTDGTNLKEVSRKFILQNWSLRRKIILTQKFLFKVSVLRNDRLSISLYDKRDYFPFSIIGMPYLCSNIPCKIFYTTLEQKF